ncbi:MAG: GNAT family N-acetyltransferase [Acidiferrobacterales bacterium]
MEYSIRVALPSDGEAMQSLFPRLASFDIPARRSAEDLWREDEQSLQAWLDGEAPDCLAHVAVDANNTVLGLSLVRLRKEMLSHEPSAHLEVLAVAREAEGKGIGRALIVTAENAAQEWGAWTITLHVFANNTRARHVYEELGYSGEIIRYIKDL